MRKLSILLAILLALCTTLSMVPGEEASAQTSPTLAPPVLYAGTSRPGLVYEYLGGTDWTVVGNQTELDNAYAVTDLAEYQGQLYAAVTTGYGGTTGVGRVYVRDRYDGTSWTRVGDNMDRAVVSLAVYKGDLYAGTGRGGFRLYKYTPGETNCGIEDWTQRVGGGWEGVRSLYVSYASGNHVLLMGDTGLDRIASFDGDDVQVVLNAGGSCIYDFEDYGAYVYAAAYRGKMWRSPDGISWSLAPGFSSSYDGNMWELEQFKGSLYMSYNNGELWESDGSGRGTLRYTAPDGIISMVTDGINLYFGTGGDAVGWGQETYGTANIYKYDGSSVQQISSDEEFGDGVQVLYSPEKVVVGYMAQNLNDLNGKRLTYVAESFAWLDSRVEGYLDHTTGYTNAGLNKRTFVDRAKAKNMIPLISIQQAADEWAGRRGTNDWSRVLSGDDTRRQLISSIVELVAEVGYMGVDIDLEALGTRDIVPYRRFVLELRNALDNDPRTNRPRPMITIAVQGTRLDRYSIAQLVDAADYIMLMGYDYHIGITGVTVRGNELPLGPWDEDPTQTPGQTRLYSCVRKHLSRIVKLGYPAGRVIYILPFYARYWRTGGYYTRGWRHLTATEREAVINSTMNEYYLEKPVYATTRRPNSIVTWWTDPACVRAKVGAALYANNIGLSESSTGNIRGVGAWMIGYDADNSELTKALWDAAHGR